MINNTDYISSWKSTGLSAESIKPPTTSHNSLTPALSYYGTKVRVKFTGSCLKPKISYVNLEKMFVIINNVGIKINADVNAKN